MGKIGEISSVDAVNRTARVKFDDEEMVSAPLKIIKRSLMSIDDDWIPQVGDFVLCEIIENSNGKGYVIGGI